MKNYKIAVILILGNVLAPYLHAETQQEALRAIKATEKDIINVAISDMKKQIAAAEKQTDTAKKTKLLGVGYSKVATALGKRDMANAALDDDIQKDIEKMSKVIAWIESDTDPAGAKAALAELLGL